MIMQTLMIIIYFNIIAVLAVAVYSDYYNDKTSFLK